MTKHIFLISTLIVSILLTGCKPKSEFAEFASIDEEYPFEAYSQEVVITGKILNWDIYPHEKELLLTVPFFRGFGQDSYRATIRKDSTFSFRFPIYAKIRQVSIYNYVEHIYVHPGDSLNILIDFEDLCHPKVTGDAEKLNQAIWTFTEDGYYYLKDYVVDYSLDSVRYDLATLKEYDLRMERRNEFIQENKPIPDVVLLTEQLIKQDYYFYLLRYASFCQSRTNTPQQSYRSMLPDIEMLYNKGVVTGRLFDLAEVLERYISNEIMLEEKKKPTLDRVMSISGQHKINQYLFTKKMVNSLQNRDTTNISNLKQEYDSIVKLPYLHGQITQLYKKAKSSI